MSNIKLSISAPGKIILFGEHSVVYGKKALACALQNKLTVYQLNSVKNGEIILDFKSICEHPLSIKLETLIREDQDLRSFCNKYSKHYSENNVKDNKFSVTALSAFLFGYLTVFKEDLPSLNIRFESDLPIGAGLGSSAAYNAVLACLFYKINGQVTIQQKNSFDNVSLDLINSLAFEMEKTVHNNPSGIDNCVSVYGRAVTFQNGSIDKIEFPELNFLIVDTCIQRNTKTMVCNVKKSYDEFSCIFSDIFSAMHNICTEGQTVLVKLKEKNYTNNEQNSLYQKLEALITLNQSLLCTIGVGHSAINDIVSICHKHKFSAKLTGAGGGGCVIVLISPMHTSHDVNELKKEICSHGYKIYGSKLGCEGITVKLYE